MSTLYRAVLGARYDALPPRVRAVHDAPRSAAGMADVDAAATPLAMFVRRLLGLPMFPGRCALRITLAADARGETWTRDFGGQPMTSTIVAHGARLREKLGLSTLDFTLHLVGDVLQWKLERVALLGIPLPLAPFRGVYAREWQEGERYAFEASATLPVVGLLIRYGGTLDVD